MRLAIGAGRGRLVRQTLTEAWCSRSKRRAGIGLAAWGTKALGAAFAEGSRPIVIDLALSGRMLLFTRRFCADRFGFRCAACGPGGACCASGRAPQRVTDGGREQAVRCGSAGLS